MQKNKCLFFDRDGVINKRIIDSYVTNPSEFELNKNILPILNFCDDNNILKIIITNQQGISKGVMTELELTNVHNYMNNIMIENKISPFDDIYFASELKNTEPFRRKPSPKMLFEAMSKYNLNHKDCIFIGDSKSDVDAAKNAKIKSIYYNKEDYDIANLSSLNTNDIIEFLSENLI